MSHGRRSSDNWKTKLIWAGLLLQSALFVLNITASVLFLRTWARMEEAAEELAKLTRGANKRLEDSERGRMRGWD